MRKIHLHGALGKKYGRVIELEVETAAETVRALATNFPEIVKDLYNGSWHLVRGEKVSTGMSLGEEDVTGFRLGRGDLHIVPHIAGAKRGRGVLKIVLGAALVGLSFGFAGVGFMAQPISSALFGATTWGQAIGSIGFAMALSGVSTLLAPRDRGQEEDRSFTFSGPTNSARPGVPVPVVYGEVITGSVLISGGIDVDQI